MAYDDTQRKTSQVIQSLFPGTYVENAPQLVEFVKAYYEWAEADGNMDNALRLLKGIRDISETPDAYLARHQAEMQQTIPKATAEGTRNLIRNILAFYRARGSEQSFKTLFRAVYGANVEIYYPYTDTMILSGSKWYQEKNIRVTLFTGNVNELTEKKITGGTSGATAVVLSINSEIISGIQYFRLVVTDIVGTFVNGELLVSEDGSIILTAQGISDYLVMDVDDVPRGGGGGGVGHQVNDTLELVGVGSTSARAQVVQVDDTNCLEVSVVYGGKGYTLGNTSVSIPGGSGTSAAVRVTALSNTSIIRVNTDLIAGALTIPLNSVNWGNTSAYPSTPFSSGTKLTSLLSTLHYKTITVGSISGLTMLNYGDGYAALPANTALTATDPYILQFYNTVDPARPSAKYGNSATFTVAHKPGYITGARVTDQGGGYQTNELVELSNLTRAAVNASATFGANNSALNILPGFYLTTSGHLSGDKKIQDSAYYNKFTYEIRAPIDQSKYVDYVKKVLHPAGTRMYGAVVLTDVLSSPLDITSNVTAVAYP